MKLSAIFSKVEKRTRQVAVDMRAALGMEYDFIRSACHADHDAPWLISVRTASDIYQSDRGSRSF